MVDIDRAYLQITRHYDISRFNAKHVEIIPNYQAENMLLKFSGLTPAQVRSILRAAKEAGVDLSALRD